VNVGLLAARRYVHLDTPLAFATVTVFAAAVLAATTHDNALGNSPFFVFPLQCLWLHMPIWTVSPLVRSLYNAVLSAALIAVGMMQRDGAFDDFMAMVVAVAVALTVLLGLYERLNRQAFAETCLASAHTAQRSAAHAARHATLGSVVPPHVVPSLRLWLREAPAARSDTPPHCERMQTLAVCTIEITLTTDDLLAAPQRMPDAHAAIDALLAKCAHLSKACSLGPRITLAGAFVSEALRYDTPAVAEAVADAVFLLAALVRLGVPFAAAVDVGEAVGAVVGSDERLGYDLHGPPVRSTQRLCAAMRNVPVFVGALDIALTPAAVQWLGCVAPVSRRTKISTNGPPVFTMLVPEGAPPVSDGGGGGPDGASTAPSAASHRADRASGRRRVAVVVSQVATVTVEGSALIPRLNAHRIMGAASTALQ